MVPHFIDTTSGSGIPTICNDQYARVLVTQQQTPLKIDFVNDSAPRFGAVVSGSLFPRIDSLRTTSVEPFR